MGVKGLWTLVKPVARPVKLETLSGKRFAIDSSIWLYHFIRAMKDKDGHTLSHAHILGFLRRILKLLFHGMKPVFVFDGGAPTLKRSTIVERKRRREGAREAHARTAEKILAAQLRQRAVAHVKQQQSGKGKGKQKAAPEPPSGEYGDEILPDAVYLEDLEAPSRRPCPSRPTHTESPPVSTPTPKRCPRASDPYDLPALPSSPPPLDPSAPLDPRLATEAELRDFIALMRPSDFDTSSPAFRTLPTEVQYEIIGDLRLRSRQTSYARLESMLRSSRTAIDFSKAQIRNLMQRNDLTQKLISHAEGMGSKEGEQPQQQIAVRVASERNKEYVLVRNGHAEGAGWVLGVRDRRGLPGEKPIEISDEEEPVEEPPSAEDSDFEMEEVDIPADVPPSPADKDADLRKLHRVQALEALYARHAPRPPPKPAPSGPVAPTSGVLRPRPPGSRPLFTYADAANAKMRAGIRKELDELRGAEEEDPELQWALDLSRAWVDDGEGEGQDAQLQRALRESECEWEARRARALDSDGEEMDEVDVSAPAAPSREKLKAKPIEVDSDSDLDHVEMSPETRRRALAASTASMALAAPAPSTTPMGWTSTGLLDEDKADELAAPAPPAPVPPVQQSTAAARLAAKARRPPTSPLRASPVPAGWASTGLLLDEDQIDADDEEAFGLSPVGPSAPAPAPASISPAATAPAFAPSPPAPGPSTAAARLASKSAHPPSPPPPAHPQPLPTASTASARLASKCISRPPSPAPASPAVARAISTTSHTAAFASEDEDEFEPVEIATAHLVAPPEPPAAIPPASPSTAVPDSPVARASSFAAPPSPAPAPSTVQSSPAPTAALDVPAESRPASPFQDQDQAERLSDAPFSDWSRSPTPAPRSERAWSPPPDIDQSDEEQEADYGAEEEEYARFASDLRNKRLDDMEKEVDQEVRTLQNQQRHATGGSDDPTQQMTGEIQRLLRLFGIPYITAPMEAEAQCAKLLELGLVDAVITDDSDVFLFGGTRVFKNMFNDKQFVECFLLNDLTRELGLDRERLVQLAFLLGSDYTDGIPGLGPVAAMELLDEFHGEDALIRFREWWLKVQSGRDTEEESGTKWKQAFKKKHKDLFLTEDWPNLRVKDAYYDPQVDPSDEEFVWGIPNLDELREFLREFLGWSYNKVDETIIPVIKNLNKKRVAPQTTLDAYFDHTAGLGAYAPRKRAEHGSARLQKVVKHFRAQNARKAADGASGSGSPSSFASSSSEDETAPPAKKPKRAAAAAPARGRGRARSARGGRRRGRGREGAAAAKRGRKKKAEEDDEAYGEEADGPESEDDPAEEPRPPSPIKPRPRPKPRPRASAKAAAGAALTDPSTASQSVELSSDSE